MVPKITSRGVIREGNKCGAYKRPCLVEPQVLNYPGGSMCAPPTVQELRPSDLSSMGIYNPSMDSTVMKVYGEGNIS